MPDYISNEEDVLDSLNGQMMGFSRNLQRQATIPVQQPQIKTRSHSIEINKLNLLQRQKVNYSNDFMISGTRSELHFRR